MLFTVTPVTGVSQNAVLALVQSNCPATRLAQASKARLKANIADLGDIEKVMRVFSQNKYIRAASVLCISSKVAFQRRSCSNGSGATSNVLSRPSWDSLAK